MGMKFSSIDDVDEILHFFYSAKEQNCFKTEREEKEL